MADTSEKGKFSTEIGSDVIADALKSVAPAAAPTSPAEGDAPAPLTETEELRIQLDLSLAKGREMMERVKDSHERMLRAAADLENFKKRAQKEREEAQRFGIERLLKDFLPVADNLERALDHSKSATDFESLREGVQMTLKLLETTLGKNGVKSFSAKGQPFDPRLHEAMQHQETSEMPPNHVSAEILRGYLLNERLVRPALVMVSKAVDNQELAPPAPEDAPADASPAATISGTSGS